MEGECRYVLQQSILEKIELSKVDDKIIVDSELQGKRGLLSNTIQHYQLGMTSIYQSIGDDFLITGIEQYLYTVIWGTVVLRTEAA